MHDHNDAAGWAFNIFGTLCLWAQSHGMGLLGIASMAFGMWVQWKTYKLRERELAARLAVAPRASA